MKPSLSKSPILVVLVIAGLTAATALVAGYVDKPNQAAQVTAGDKCDGCPLLNTEACCKVTGVCANPQTCPNPCAKGTSEAQPAGCCPKATQAVWPMMSDTTQATCPMTTGQAPSACPMMAGQKTQVEGSCGAGGCADAEQPEATNNEI